MEKVISQSDFLIKTSKKGRSFLLFYKADSDQSICAFKNIENATRELRESEFLTADVSISYCLMLIFMPKWLKRSRSSSFN